MSKAFTRILLIIIVLSMAVLGCVGGGGNGNRSGSNSGSSNQSEIYSPDATATFGAQELYIQLTEIARDEHK